MTFLVGTGFSFSNMNLDNISIPYANLENAIMHKTSLKGADLNNVNFSNSFLLAANLSSANLQNAYFGEEPTLFDHSRGLTSISFSKDDKFLLSCSYDGVIKIWNVDTYNLLLTLDNPVESNDLLYDQSAAIFSNTNYNIASFYKENLFVVIWNIKEIK